MTTIRQNIQWIKNNRNLYNKANTYDCYTLPKNIKLLTLPTMKTFFGILEKAFNEMYKSCIKLHITLLKRTYLQHDGQI